MTGVSVLRLIDGHPWRSRYFSSRPDLFRPPEVPGTMSKPKGAPRNRWHDTRPSLLGTQTAITARLTRAEARSSCPSTSCLFVPVGQQYGKG